MSLIPPIPSVTYSSCRLLQLHGAYLKYARKVERYAKTALIAGPAFAIKYSGLDLHYSKI